jgi:hypothetical protein
LVKADAKLVKADAKLVKAEKNLVDDKNKLVVEKQKLKKKWQDEKILNNNCLKDKNRLEMDIKASSGFS